jgi:hypothetical protein
VFCVLEPEILYTWEVAVVLLLAEILTFSVPSLVRLKAIGTVVLLVQSKILMLLADTFDALDAVHWNVLVPPEIVSPTSSMVDCADIENAVNAGV